jgi:hypothetical protein
MAKSFPFFCPTNPAQKERDIDKAAEISGKIEEESYFFSGGKKG